MAKTEVPVTMGRRVRSVAAVADDVARADAPGARDRDIVKSIKVRRDGMVKIVVRLVCFLGVTDCMNIWINSNKRLQ